MSCEVIASRSASTRSLHIVNATLCLIDDCPVPSFPKGITMDVAEFMNDLTARLEDTIAGIRSSRVCMGMHQPESDGRLVSSMRLL
eukprot:8077277-Heterocapsa_arctica.AAC.1